MIPVFAVIRIRPGFSLWIPLVLIYLLLLPLLLLVSPIALLACLFLLINPFHLVGIFWEILSAFRGTCIDVESGVHHIYIRII